MAKIKLTKGELKKQRDALKQFERYLPTLQLKKQQLQIEILHLNAAALEKQRQLEVKKAAAMVWAGLLTEIDLPAFKPWLVPAEIIAGVRNVAGVDLPVFERARFTDAAYDLFLTPAWVDGALEFLREQVVLREEIRVMVQAIETLKRELRITTQRVNLFEKVKIPEAQDAIRRIKIYIGDQMANAVGRSKIAKRKIEALEALEVAA
ncbi:MAG TPA: V-type ATP synthase subunit D [Candidatus Omnitrophota bacterium]|nr:V-type ATP synthase subunit D [Candidatus Omnitrophota bacterium]